MNVLILGANGMLGSQLLHYFVEKGLYDVIGTIRRDEIPVQLDPYKSYLQFNVDAIDFTRVEHVIDDNCIDLVINCVGVIKQSDALSKISKTIYLNAVFPHLLNELAQQNNFRVIQVSTDCVFNGERGEYSESDVPNALDLYGRTKYLGEICGDNSITIRTSIIGHELYEKKSLLDWFINEPGEVHGFKNAIFSGLPTIELARLIHDYIIPNRKINGVYHISGTPISKYALLSMINETYSLGKEIIPDEGYKIDRSLDSRKFQNLTGYRIKRWDRLILELKKSRWWCNEND